MKKILTLVMTLAAASAVRAQSVGLDLSLEFDTYLAHEMIPLKLTVSNHGATPFIIDDYGAYVSNSISIFVKHESEGYLDPTVKAKPVPSLMLAQGQSDDLIIPVDAYFPMQRTGKYTVQAFARRTVEGRAEPESVSSRILVFTVVNGMEIGSESRIVPGSDSLSRRYSLRYWARGQHEELFLRVDEFPEDKAVALFRLGYVVRYETPKIEFFPDGKIEVVHQVGRDRFVKTVIQSDLSRLEVVDRQRLLDPNQSPYARHVLERNGAPGADGDKGFRRRVHPAASKPEK